METLLELLENEFKKHDESFSDIVSKTITNKLLGRKFKNEFGPVMADPFFIWTFKRVYFTVNYDGTVEVNSVPRKPCDEKPHHF